MMLSSKTLNQNMLKMRYRQAMGAPLPKPSDLARVVTRGFEPGASLAN